MVSWLLIAAVSQAAAANAGADMRGLAPGQIGQLAAARVLDFRLRQDSSAAGSIPLIRSMIVQHDLAPNAAIGIGLSNLYDKRKSGIDGVVDSRPKRSRKPAVTFVLKF